jgi:hypothetical protein
MTRGRPVALLPIRAAVHALSIHRLGFSAFARLRRHASLILLRFPGVTRVVKVIPEAFLHDVWLRKFAGAPSRAEGGVTLWLVGQIRDCPLDTVSAGGAIDHAGRFDQYVSGNASRRVCAPA